MSLIVSVDIKHSVYFTLHSEGRESRRGQDQGGGAGVPKKVGQSFACPGEIKRREVELDLQESPGEIKSKAVELGCYREPAGPSFASLVPQQLLFGHCLCGFAPHSFRNSN